MTSSGPTLEDWVRTVEDGLGGRSYASLFWQTLDGFAVAPLATRADVEGLPHLRAVPLLQGRRGVAIRELVCLADPADANARLKRALDRGVDEVELALDACAQDAFPPGAADDTDDLSGAQLPGDGGVAIHARPDLDAALDGIDLAATSVSFSAGEGALPVLAWLLRLADSRGTPRAALRGGLDVDPIARLTCRRLGFAGGDGVASHRAAIEPVFGETVAALRACGEHCPNVRPVVVDGQGFHLAGAPPAFEVGATLASAIDVARRLGGGGVTFDELAAGTSVRVQVGHELLTEIAKLRALRLLWAKTAAAFGAGVASLSPRVLGVTSGRFRAEEHDQRTNLVRTALASFAAMVGGCDSVIATPWIETDDGAAADLARDQLHLLRAEAHVDRTGDPTGGSFTIERLTHEICRVAWGLVHDIEHEGGFIAAARGGFLAERLQIAEDARERAFRTRHRVLVGISRFADPELGGPADEPGDVEDLGEILLERHASWLAARDASSAEVLLRAISGAAADRFFDHALEDEVDHASLAELATATWPPEGVVFEHRFAPIAVTDGHEFEELRTRAEIAREDGTADPVVLLVPFGDPKSARPRADFARDLLQVGGLTVEEVEPPGDAGAVAELLRARAPAAAMLCAADADYPELVAGLGSLPSRPHLLVAGRVDDALRAQVDGSAHAGMDAVAFLSSLLDALGVPQLS